MEELEFNRMISAIVSGLYEKEQNNDKYPYSEHLLYGINIFSALAFQQKQFDLLAKMNEASFITEYAVRPVKEWFFGWDNTFVSQISQYPLYETNALIKLYDKRNYSITEECENLYSNAENDMFNALEQNYIYLMMKELSPQKYTSVRKFIVQHPVCNDTELRKIKIKYHDPDITEIIAAAYEDVPENSYRCPVCGWTMTFHGIQSFCCNQSCTESNPSPEQLDKIDTAKYMRLKHGVMRYMCLPGKLELAIQVEAERCGNKTELWPEKDRYDIKIVLSDGEIWAIDAKTHRNPYTLTASIKNDHQFFSADADKRFYVVPKKHLEVHADYCDICNAALKEKKAKLITDEELYRMIRRRSKNG